MKIGLCLRSFSARSHRTLAENRQLTGCGTNDDVAVNQLIRDFREQHRMRTKLLSQLARTFERAVGDDNAFNALIVQVPSHQADGLASTNQ